MTRHRPTVGVCVAILSILCFASVSSAQSPRPAFEVASIKRNLSGSQGGNLNVQPGGRLVATNQSVTNLIQFAYGIVEPQLIDAPNWVKADRFDINAKAATEAPESDIRLMLQSLFEDRFRLVVRKEQREMPVQEVVLNRDDGRLGPRLVQVSSQEECQTAAANMPKSQAPPGAVFAMFRQCGSLPPILTRFIFLQLRTMAVDKTGLSGTWFVSVYFAPEGATNARQVEIDPNVPSFVTAFQEQLGLKLRSGRGLVDVVTILSIQPPTED